MSKDENGESDQEANNFEILRSHLIEGEKSGDAGELDFNEIKKLARKRAGISSNEK